MTELPILSSLKIILLCLTLFLTSLPLLVISKFPANEQVILLNIKKQWGNQPLMLSWNSTTSPCHWPGIQCSAGGETVTGISLIDENIAGEIPASICDLENLTTLDLSYNHLEGGFPTLLYNCSKLQFLNLSYNLLGGQLPNDINSLSPQLQHLDLSSNNFTGDIQSSIGQLKALIILYLYNNQFNGTFPSELGNLVNLESLDLSFNPFSPMKLPTEFGMLKSLKLLSMFQCNLMGEIPRSFANLTSLEQIALSNNYLVGQIPSGLYLLKNLTSLTLEYNKLSGQLPHSIKALKLKYIELGMNNLTGTIPDQIGNLQRLETLTLYENRFSGHLPEKLCAGGVLISLFASYNNFSGEIPVSLAKCNSLKHLTLRGNRLSGKIHVGLWTLPNMSELYIGDNKFSGNLPSQLSENLQWLIINNNNFSGPIPSGIANSKNLIEFLASNNQLSGAIPLGLTSLSNLTFLELDGNQLSGELPSKLISWKSLATLNMAKNKLSGPIPTALGSLPHLNCLELSNNMFSGHIPPELGRLKLSTLDLSFNNLTGMIPSAFDDMTNQYNFMNNSNLCLGGIQTPNLPECSFSQYKRLPIRYLAIISVLVAVIVLVILYFIFSKEFVFQQRKHDVEQQAWIMTRFHNLNFSEENILCGLTEDNVIGSGGAGKIYCVDIIDDGGKMAIKRIWNGRIYNDALEKQFLAEVEILGRIRHTNIVKLWCCISRPDLKLLVYEYMENQSLDKWLHKKRRACESSSTHSTSSRTALNPHDVLDWPTRLRIAIGAAKGLCYMHHDCSPAIIHRDVKSSNILLDSEFNAKIADFGLAKISSNKTGELHTASSVAGTFGYIAPEYWRTKRLNEKIDIYSFGVVLLELATGKEPCRGNEHLNLAQWSWQHYIKGHPIVDALDNEINEPCFSSEMIQVFKLGLLCTNTVPSSRPTMKQVSQLLALCRRYDEEAFDRRTHTRTEEENVVNPILRDN